MEKLFPELFGMFTVNPFFYAALLVFRCICGWKLFVKMGERGWKALIPVYNIWVLLRRVDRPVYWVVWLVGVPAAAIGFLIDYLRTGYYDGSIVFPILFLGGAVYALILSIRMYHALSLSFGRDKTFTIGLVLLPVVFVALLAFGDDRYLLESRSITENFG